MVGPDSAWRVISVQANPNPSDFQNRFILLPVLRSHALGAHLSQLGDETTSPRSKNVKDWQKQARRREQCALGEMFQDQMILGCQGNLSLSSLALQIVKLSHSFSPS